MTNAELEDELRNTRIVLRWLINKLGDAGLFKAEDAIQARVVAGLLVGEVEDRCDPPAQVPLGEDGKVLRTSGTGWFKGVPSA